MPSEPGPLRARSAMLKELREHVKEHSNRDKKIVSYQWLRDVCDEDDPLRGVEPYRMELFY